jgi:hypothetical protein
MLTSFTGDARNTKMGLLELIQALAVLLLCLIHLFIGRMHFLHRGKSWLSFSGGAASAYVFVYLLPKLGYQQIILAGAAPQTDWLGYLQHHAYLVAFAGFLTYFAVSRAGQKLEVPADQTPNDALSHPLEALHILFMALYSVLVGYLITDYARGLTPVILGTIALMLHFMGADHVLLESYKSLYQRLIRWLLVGATLTGACIGVLTTLSPTVFALWFAFLAGAILVNVLEEELPEGRDSNFQWFLIGAVTFSALILGLEFSAV